MNPERSKKDQLREHVAGEIVATRQQVTACQTILRELNIKLGTARTNLKRAEESLSKATLHLAQVENGTYQPPLFPRDADERPSKRRSIAVGTLSHGPRPAAKEPA